MTVRLYHGSMPFTHPFCDACPENLPHQNIERQGDCIQIKLDRVWLALCWKHLEQLSRELAEYFGAHPSEKRHDPTL